MTVGEAIAVGTLWDNLRWGRAIKPETWEAYRLLAAGAHKVLMAGVTPEDVERRALVHGHDIRKPQKIRGAV